MERSLLSSDARGKSDALNTDDRISRLSDDLLLKILSRLSTEEAMRTSVLSSRWEDVWKGTSHLFLDLRKFNKIRTRSTDAARSMMAKVIKNHSGHLEKCTILYFSFQCGDGMVEPWIEKLIHVNHVKNLEIVNSLRPFKPITESTTLDLPPKTLSHQNLVSLYLGRYTLDTPRAFDNCRNLRILKLVSIFAKMGVFNAVLASCPSLEALVLDIICKRNGVLKIENRNLKLLCLYCYVIDGVEVSSPNLNVLTLGDILCEKENFVIANPSLGHFDRTFWTTGDLPHTSYSISSHHQEKKSRAHELLMSEPGDYIKKCSSLSVSVDLTNAKEVEMLHETLVALPGKMEELEIIFKNSNTSIKKDGLTNGKTHENFWEETKSYLNPHLGAYSIWLCNFSGSQEESAFASCLITQGMVMKSMTIKPLFYSAEIEATITKLKEIPRGHKELSIIMI